MIYIKINKTRVNDYSTASENSYFFGDKSWFIIVIFPEWNERQKGKINVIQVKIPACVEYNIFTRYFFKFFYIMREKIIL